jgi:hypothetical protein
VIVHLLGLGQRSVVTVISWFPMLGRVLVHMIHIQLCLSPSGHKSTCCESWTDLPGSTGLGSPQISTGFFSHYWVMC